MLSSGESGRSITIICATNAAGNYIPSFFVFTRVHNLNALMINAFHGYGSAGTKYRWSDNTIFMKWLKHFNNVAKPSIENPHIWILDGQYSHKSSDAVKFAKKNAIIIIMIPLHSTHKMQPLDRTFLKV